ncbi:MAG TPA: 3-oxoacyl-[acyl-carrier-protein] synthase III C-terminal domain-containing protein [Solirubrobacteraceae bacterium]|nr:3-oxoacyl-[acyl-carrier-protein] synthase III C-terminal domain-containing protein [Solirubrobacteraceae bacterium]
MRSTVHRAGANSAPGVSTLTPRRRRRAPMVPRIAALSLADEPTTHDQAQVLERLGLAADEFAEGIFSRCGVQQRHLELDEEFSALSFQGRAAHVERELLARSIRAVDGLGADLERIGTLISASLYSLGVPSLAHRLIDHYRLDPATDKYHVTGVGCASGVPLMKLAAQAVRGQAEHDALIVAAESMSSILSRAREDDPRAKTVGASIFGDGCGAALISAHPGAEGPAITAAAVHQIAGTLDAVSLHVHEEDAYLHLARELPDIAGAELGAVVDRFLHGNRLRREDIDHWVLHPGGRRIIENVQSALELTDEQARISRDSLAEHGNVGTPSIFYVLKATVEQCRPQAGERGLMVTIGPGVTIGMMLLEW